MERRLRTIILVYLWVALAEDTVLFLMAWLAPNIWFRVFHAAAPAGLETAFLRRSPGQWAAVPLAPAITLWRWREGPGWLALAAARGFSHFVAHLSDLPA